MYCANYTGILQMTKKRAHMTNSFSSATVTHYYAELRIVVVK